MECCERRNYRCQDTREDRAGSSLHSWIVPRNDQEPDVVDEDNHGGGDIPYTEAPIDCSALA